MQGDGDPTVTASMRRLTSERLQARPTIGEVLGGVPEALLASRHHLQEVEAGQPTPLRMRLTGRRRRVADRDMHGLPADAGRHQRRVDDLAGCGRDAIGGVVQPADLPCKAAGCFGLGTVYGTGLEAGTTN